MLRTVFAIAVAGLIFAAVSGPAQAAPIAPLPPGYTVDLGLLSDVQWRRCWRDRWGACIAVAAGATVGAVSAAGDLTLTPLS